MIPYLFPTNLQIPSRIYKCDINVNISICIFVVDLPVWRQTG